MLELIFRIFLEWLYSLLVGVWEFIAEGLLDIMSLDFAYLQTHVPIIPQMSQLLLAVGWALLLGNLVFQALKSMAAGLGFEGEDPKLLFSRTFVFAFLLMASPQICRIGLDLTSNIMDLLKVPSAVNVGSVDEGVFGPSAIAWLMVIICNVIVMFKVLGLVIEVAERYVILAVLTITAPLAFAMGGSKNTASIFSGWCRMFGSMCLLMVTNLVCCKLLFSVLSTIPSGLDVLSWMVLIFAIVKVAKKSDSIITRIGLNPAVTGGSGKTLPGMLAYTVVRTAVNQVVKGMGGGGSGSGGGRSAKAPSSGANRNGGSFTRPSGGNAGGGRYSSQSPGGTGGGYTYQNSRQQNASRQSTSQQADSQQSSNVRGGGRQTGAQQENTSHAAAQQPTNGSITINSSSRSSQGGPRGTQGRQTRRSSVPSGTRRSPSHIPSAGGTPQPPGISNTQTSSGQPGSSAPGQPDSSRPGVAGNQAKNAMPKQPNAPRPGPAGTVAANQSPRKSNTTQTGANGKAGTAGIQNKSKQTNNSRPGPAGNPARNTAPKQPKGTRSGHAGTGTRTQSTRSAHTASRTVSNGTVNNSTRTNVAAGGGTSGTAAPRQPHPGGSNVSPSPPKIGKTRSTKQDNMGAVPKTPTTLSPGSSRPGSAGKAARSTQRPSEPAPRPGRNTPPATAASPTGGTSSGTIRQERASSPNRDAARGTTPSPAPREHVSNPSRDAARGTAPGPAPQEPRRAASPTSPSVKGRASTVRTGPAETARTNPRAAGKKHPAAHSSKRPKSARHPPPLGKGGSGHG